MDGWMGVLFLCAEKVDDALLWPTDDGFVSLEEDGALEELFVFYEDVDHCGGVVDEVIWIKLEFFEFGVFADEVFYGVF